MTKCKICKAEYTKQRMMQKCCSTECAEIFGKNKTKQEFEKKMRSDTKDRKEKLKSLNDWIRDAQTVFNRYIRLRDSFCSCICCGNLPFSTSEVGGLWDAGHFRSRGSSGHLRFNEDNCHAQLKKCNRWNAGNIVGYRMGLIERIGIERVEALERNNDIHKWTVTELKEIIAKYKLKIKELESTKDK